MNTLLRSYLEGEDFLGAMQRIGLSGLSSESIYFMHIVTTFLFYAYVYYIFLFPIE